MYGFFKKRYVLYGYSKIVRIARIFFRIFYGLYGFFSKNVQIFVRIFSKSFGHPEIGNLLSQK